MSKRQRAIKEFKLHKKLEFKKSLEFKQEREMLSSVNNDVLWSFPFISESEHTSDLAIKQNLDELCNQERIATIKLSRNSHMHPSVNYRSSLKDDFNSHKPIYWQATVSDISMPKSKSHGGILLLDHVIKRKFETDNFSVGFNSYELKDQIDYHIWLPVNQIRYMGKVDQRSIAIGDVIVGQSLVERYYDSQHNIHYGLGKTIIFHCGIPLVKDYFKSGSEIKTVNAKFIDDYNRFDDWVVKLTYPLFYQSILNRYRKIDIKTLQYIKGHVWSYYKPSKYSKFYDLNTTKAMITQYRDLKNNISGRD